MSSPAQQGEKTTERRSERNQSPTPHDASFAPASSPRRGSAAAGVPVRLNKSLKELLAKPKDVFVRELYAFMEHIGQPITKMPSLGYQELDLHRLFTIVVSKGGMDEVTRRQEWKLVYQELDIPTMSTSASYNTRTNYKKYLYLYELDVCDWSEERPAEAPGPRFQVGDYVRIVSSTYEGQVFYAQISKYRYRNDANSYYVHYNGWSTSHDEWMPEPVLSALQPEETDSPAELCNPSPTRSSKSNYIIYDPLVSEKHHQRIPASVHLAAMSAGHASAGSVQPSPKSKRKRSSPGKEERQSQLADSDDVDQEAGELILGPASAQPRHYAQQSASPSPAVGRSRRRAGGNGKGSGGKTSFFLEEMDHPACDDKIYGYPRRRRGSLLALDFELGMPEQLYYYGGQWKHTTPRVRKFHLHRSMLEGSRLGVPLSEELYQQAMQPRETVLPDVPLLKLPKMPPISRSLGIPQLHPRKLDARPVAAIAASIAEKETRLRALKKDLKHKTRLLHRYYGKPETKSNASALLSSSFRVNRR